MELTKFTHSCVRVDQGNRALVFDPGFFSELDAALDGVDTVLVTHEHPDHVDVEAVRAAARKNTSLRVFAPGSVAVALSDLGDQVVEARPGEKFDAGGFIVETFGGQHATIHSSIPTIANICYLVDEAVYHPGDSLVVPPKSVDVALVPIHAPWCTIADVMDFTVAMRAPRAYQIHEYLLSDFGRGFSEDHVAEHSHPFGIDFAHLDTLRTVSV